MTARSTPGIFCLENNWSSDLRDRSTVRPLLELMEEQGGAPFIHRDVGTRHELQHYLKIWTQRRYDRYKVGFLAFHGDPGALLIGRESLGLSELAGILKDRCQGRIVYLGSCSVLETSWKEWEEFLSETKAAALCGYLEDIDWLESAAFELLLMDTLGRFKRVDPAVAYLERHYKQLLNRLEFVSFTQADLRHRKNKKKARSR